MYFTGQQKADIASGSDSELGSVGEKSTADPALETIVSADLISEFGEYPEPLSCLSLQITLGNDLELGSDEENGVDKGFKDLDHTSGQFALINLYIS